MTTVNIPSIQVTLKDLMPRTAQQLTCRIAKSPLQTSRKQAVLPLYIMHRLKNYHPQIRNCTPLIRGIREQHDGQLNYTEGKEQVKDEGIVEERHKLTVLKDYIPPGSAE